MEIVAMDRPDIVKVRDLTTDKVSVVHQQTAIIQVLCWNDPWIRIGGLAVIDVDEYFVESITDESLRKRLEREE